MRLSTTRAGSEAAPALPQPYPALRQAGVVFRRGQQSLIVAAPGVGKSVLLTNLAVRMKVPTLFLSADSNEDTVLQRVVAILTNTDVGQVERNLSDPGWRDYYNAAVVADQRHIDWQFDTDITVGAITKRVSAYTEIRGKSPQLVVVDNLRDAVESSGSERSYAGFEEVQDGLKKLARATRAHFVSLHHATGEYENGDKMIPLGGVEGKLSKIPEQVFTLWRTGPGEIGVHAPKNRSGEPRATASLQVDLARQTVYGYDN